MAISRFDKAQAVKPVSQYVPLNLPWEQVARTVQMKDAQQKAAMDRIRKEAGTSIEKLDEYEGLDNVDFIGPGGQVMQLPVGYSERASQIKSSLYNEAQGLSQRLATTDLTKGTSEIADDLYNLKRKVNKQTSQGGYLYKADNIRKGVRKAEELLSENWDQVSKDASVAQPYNQFLANVLGQDIGIGDEYSERTRKYAEGALSSVTPRSFTGDVSPTNIAEYTDIGEKVLGAAAKMEEQGYGTPPQRRGDFWVYNDVKYRKADAIDKFSKDLMESNPEIQNTLNRQARQKKMFDKDFTLEDAERWKQAQMNQFAEMAINQSAFTDRSPTYKKYDSDNFYGTGYSREELMSGSMFGKTSVEGTEQKPKPPFYDALKHWNVIGLEDYENNVDTWKEKDLGQGLLMGLYTYDAKGDEFSKSENYVSMTDKEITIPKGTGTETIKIKAGEKLPEGYIIKNTRGVTARKPILNKDIEVSDGTVIPKGVGVPTKYSDEILKNHSGAIETYPMHIIDGDITVVSDRGESVTVDDVQLGAVAKDKTEAGDIFNGAAQSSLGKTTWLTQRAFGVNPQASTATTPEGRQPQQEEQPEQEEVKIDFESF